MYNSSIKGQSHKIHFDAHMQIPGKVMFNDMSRNYILPEFRACDVIYSEIAWSYGYPIFNKNANNEPSKYSDYMSNINRLIHTLKIPAFVVCGKPAKKYFEDAKKYDIAITTAGTKMPGCTLYVWNSDYSGRCGSTKELIDMLSSNYNKCLDFSCGYGEHLLKFNDFVGCDIDFDCLTYLSKKYMEGRNGET